MGISVKGFKFEPIEPANRGGRSGAFSEWDLIFATDRKSVAGGVTYGMRIGISQAFAKKARIIDGDRVEILFDKEEKAGLIRRVNDGGHQISSYGKKNTRLYIKPTIKPGMPTVAETVGCPSEILDEGIMFLLPDCVSFDRNLRAEAMDQ
jgi:hypothetical protein